MKPEHTFDAKEVINKYLFGDISVFEEQNRGRPRIIRSTEFVDLFEELKKKCLDGAVKTLNQSSNPRVDAVLTSFFRKVKKIPLILLQYCGSKTQYKDKGLMIPLISYIESFRKGFMKLFSNDKNDSKIFELFLGFISTSLPAMRVKKILDNFRDSRAIGKELHLLYITLSQISRGTSKKDIQNNYEQNPAFRAMVNELPTILNRGNLQFNQEAYNKLLKKMNKQL